MTPTEDEVIVRVLTPLGIVTGEFRCIKTTLPQLVAINKSPEGGNYFRWEGIKKEECL